MFSALGARDVEEGAVIAVHGTQDPITSNVAFPIGRNSGQESALIYKQDNAWAVRKLTPLEAERLQGFPDGYTDIKPNGKPTPDTPRYKAIGNSFCVPVIKWIGLQITKAHYFGAPA